MKTKNKKTTKELEKMLKNKKSKNSKDKIVKKIMILLFLISFAFTQAQDDVYFNISQDIKLATMTDDYGNTPYTADIYLNLELQGRQFNNFYFSTGVNYEYADLKSKFSRFGVFGKFTFNNFKLERLEVSPSINYGLLTREYTDYNLSWYSAGVDLEVTYIITDRFKLFVTNQFTQRTDLSTVNVRYSLFAGVKVNIYKRF